MRRDGCEADATAALTAPTLADVTDRGGAGRAYDASSAHPLGRLGVDHLVT